MKHYIKVTIIGIGDIEYFRNIKYFDSKNFIHYYCDEIIKVH